MGGGWVAYEWRNSACDSKFHKGAYIIKVSKWGRNFYAGVGYSLISYSQSQTQSPLSTGMYGFIFDAEGLCIAHGASRSFVGRTLAQIVEHTHNSQIDSDELFSRFTKAAQLGGGWVSYPWRNSPSEPLRIKGAFVSQLVRQAPTSSPLQPLGSMLEKLPLMYVGFGYFGGHAEGSPLDAETAPCAVPPSRTAAKAATARLKQQLLQVLADDHANDDNVSAELHAVVQDDSGCIADAAAEAVCWEATDLPDKLSSELHHHTHLYLKSFE